MIHRKCSNYLRIIVNFFLRSLPIFSRDKPWILRYSSCCFKRIAVHSALSASTKRKTTAITVSLRGRYECSRCLFDDFFGFCCGSICDNFTWDRPKNTDKHFSKDKYGTSVQSRFLQVHSEYRWNDCWVNFTKKNKNDLAQSIFGQKSV